MFRRAVPTEVKLVTAFIQRERGSYTALLEYFNNRSVPLQCVGRDYVGMFGGVRVCADIYGYEVKVGWDPSAALLDCVPAYYGLVDERASALYEAILSCVPGSVMYAEKQIRQGRMITS